jgi:hypothetical protein
MAKIPTIRNYDAFYTDSFDFNNAVLIDASKRMADYVDPSSMNDLVFTGQNLRFEHGMIVRGTITSISLRNEDGDLIQKISNLRVDATEIAGTTPQEFASFVVARFSFHDTKLVGGSGVDTLNGQRSNNVLIGNGGADTLNGNEGKDTMTGNAGNDIFVFEPGSGRDVITDFDAIGGAGFQDRIDATYPGAGAVSQSGKNDTLINFGNGDTMKLLGIDPDDINASDFM